MGLGEPSLLELASGDDVVAHVGLPVLRFEGLGAPPGERVTARGEHGLGVPVLAADDGGCVAERVCRDAIWLAPAARGIGGLGSRAQGCPQWIFLFADADFVREIRRSE